MSPRQIMRQLTARHNARRHLALYSKTGNGALVWKAFQEYRRFALPVPEQILVELDKMAGALLSAQGQKEIAAAVGMTGLGGGPQGTAAIKGQENARDIVEYFHFMRNNNDGADNHVPIRKLAEEVGAKFGLSADNVQSRYSKWLSDDQKPSDTGDVLQALINRQNRTT